MFRNISGNLIAALAILLSCSLSAADERPNILWITAEDMSATLGCYGDRFAHTPNIDRLASESVRYTHAFATAPVCSPSRSCLITGCYAPSLGTQQMRSAFPIPERMKGFPSYLREAGYYTSNNVKTDYNTSNWQEIVEASWDESSNAAHWRGRKNERQPFFSVFNLMTSHQSRSMVWPRQRFVKEVQSRLSPSEIHDPEKVPLPPYYPDTPVIRRTVARYYDCVTAMDKEVGAVLQQLEDDGLAGDTIVFFYSDHGSGMPRHKRALLDSGMHVPLLIRFPKKYQHLAPGKPGETTGRLVSFVDFAPTVLRLSGVKAPDYMQGKPFLGEQESTPREMAYGHRDRVDEAFDVARSVRDHRYLYIRNYMPHLGYNQFTAWPDQGEIRHEFYRLADPEKMTPAQWQFAGPTRPAEELYDCKEDPRNLHNLVAGSPKHQETLQRMRNAHQRHLRETRDVGFMPESEAWRFCEGTTPWEAARNSDVDLAPLYQAASQVGLGDESAFLKNLKRDNPSIRYWGVIGFASLENISDKTRQALLSRLEDSSPAVRIEAANVLARHGDAEHALPVLREALTSVDLNVVLHATRTVELLGDSAAELVPAMKQVLVRAGKIRPADTPATVVQSGDQDLAMFISFAANGFLTRVTNEPWRELFDGKSLDGWTARAKGDVQAKDGEIQILSKGQNLWLVHDEQFEDFELTVEAMMPDDAYNSGIGFRCVGAGKPKGYQCEIAGPKSGMIYAIGSGWVWPKGADENRRFQQMTKGAFKDGQWNKFRIRCEGNHIQIWLNGVQTADIRDPRFRRGSVALQHHGKGGLHRFRNIRIREL